MHFTPISRNLDDVCQMCVQISEPNLDAWHGKQPTNLPCSSSASPRILSLSMPRVQRRSSCLLTVPLAPTVHCNRESALPFFRLGACSQSQAEGQAARPQCVAGRRPSSCYGAEACGESVNRMRVLLARQAWVTSSLYLVCTTSTTVSFPPDCRSITLTSLSPFYSPPLSLAFGLCPLPFPKLSDFCRIDGR